MFITFSIFSSDKSDSFTTDSSFHRETLLIVESIVLFVVRTFCWRVATSSDSRPSVTTTFLRVHFMKTTPTRFYQNYRACAPLPLLPLQSSKAKRLRPTGIEKAIPFRKCRHILTNTTAAPSATYSNLFFASSL